MEVCVLQVFFLFSSTKIGHGRPSVKDRYAISDKNILRSYVVRYFYLKFLACRSSMPWEMYKKKEKKCWGGAREAVYIVRFRISLFLCDGHVIDAFLICFTPILEYSSKICKFLLFHFVTIALLSRISYSYPFGGAFRPAS